MSNSLEKLPRTRETQDSSRIRPVLEYAEADHIIHEVTPKVGKGRGKYSWLINKLFITNYFLNE